MLLPLCIVLLVLMIAGPFWLFGIIIPPFQAALCVILGISRDGADVICLCLMLFSPFLLLLLLFFLYRHYGLFCPKCGPWTHHRTFIRHVSKYGTCPKCKCQVLDVA